MRDVAVRFSVMVVATGGVVTPMEWRVRARHLLPGMGRPTSANLATFMRRMADMNDWLNPVSAKVVDHFNGNAVVASWSAVAVAA